MLSNKNMHLLKSNICKSNRIRLLNSFSSKYLSQLGATFNQKPPRSQQTQFKSSPNLSSSFKNISKLFPFASTTSSSSSATSSSNQNVASRSPFSSFLTDERTSKSSSGLFGKSELTSHEGFYKLKDRAEKRVTDLTAEALASGEGKRKLVEIFDDISNELCCVADLAEFVRTSHPSVHFREAANLTFSSISQIVEKLNTNYELYARLKSSLQTTASCIGEGKNKDASLCK